MRLFLFIFFSLVSVELSKQQNVFFETGPMDPETKISHHGLPSSIKQIATNTKSKSWIEEEREVIKQMLEVFDDDAPDTLLTGQSRPQLIKSSNGIYKIGLCFYKDEDEEEIKYTTTTERVIRYPGSYPTRRAEYTTEKPNKNICLLRPDPGLCKASFTAYYYHPNRGECYPFVYGGCDGNENRFHTREECLDKCKNKT